MKYDPEFPKKVIFFKFKTKKNNIGIIKLRIKND